MSARTLLVDELAAALPDVPIVGFSTNPTVTKPTVMLWQQTVAPAGRFGLSHVEYGLQLWALVGNENTENAEDALDVLVERVLFALHALDWISWDSAERGVYGDPPTYQGWALTLRAVARITNDDDTEGA